MAKTTSQRLKELETQNEHLIGQMKTCNEFLQNTRNFLEKMKIIPVVNDRINRLDKQIHDLDEDIQDIYDEKGGKRIAPLDLMMPPSFVKSFRMREDVRNMRPRKIRELKRLYDEISDMIGKDHPEIGDVRKYISQNQHTARSFNHLLDTFKIPHECKDGIDPLYILTSKIQELEFFKEGMEDLATVFGINKDGMNAKQISRAVRARAINSKHKD